MSSMKLNISQLKSGVTLSQLTGAQLASLTQNLTGAEKARFEDLVEGKIECGMTRAEAEEAARRQIVRDAHPELDVSIP